MINQRPDDAKNTSFFPGSVEAWEKQVEPPVREAIEKNRSSLENSLYIHTLLSTWAVARAAGLRWIEAIAEDVWIVESPAGERMILTFASLGGLEDSSSDDSVQKLTQAIQLALGEWCFILHLRRPLPKAFDPEPVARAVHIWRMALDRDEWQGHHAVYEDDQVAVDLSVTHRREPGEQWWMTMPPLTGGGRFTQIYEALLKRVAATDAFASLPIIFCPVAMMPWSLPRGTILMGLYGTAEATLTSTTTNERSFEAIYHSEAVSLFSDPLCARVHRIWWIENHPYLHSLSSVSYENPWSTSMMAVRFPGPQFSVLQMNEGAQRKMALVRWVDAPTPTWGQP